MPEWTTKYAIQLLGCIIFLGLGLAWKQWIYPQYVEWFMERTKLPDALSGTLDFGKGANSRIVVKPRKRGYVVTGSLEFVDGEHRNDRYSIKGRYSHGLLTFEYVANNAASTSQGTATFQRLQDGKLFKGAFAYFSQQKDSVDSVGCELRPVV